MQTDSPTEWPEFYNVILKVLRQLRLLMKLSTVSAHSIQHTCPGPLVVLVTKRIKMNPTSHLYRASLPRNPARQKTVELQITVGMISINWVSVKQHETTHSLLCLF